MTLEVFGTYMVALLIVVGGVFMMVGAIGLLRFNDSMTRLHAPTKVGTIGVGSLLAASMVHAALAGHGWMHELLIMAFLFVTAPISANFMAKVNIHRRACDPLPDPPQDETWSTLKVPEADLEIEEQKQA